MRGGSVSPERYKAGERNYRMLRGLLKSSRSVSINFPMQAIGCPEIADEELREVRGVVSTLLRLGERPFVGFQYLEYAEIERAQRDLRARITQGPGMGYDPSHRPVSTILSLALEGSESISMQTELGIIPVGMYCPTPVRVALDSCTILGIAYEAEPMASPSH